MSALLRLGGIAVAVVGLQRLLVVFDWGEGIARAALVLALGVAFALGRADLERRVRLPTSVVALACVLAAWGALSAAGTGVSSVRRTARTDRIELDQGQIVYRALLLWPRGVNPWGADTMLDPDELALRVERWRARAPGCVRFRRDPARALDSFWWHSLSPREMADLVPDVADAPECEGAFEDFHSRGFHYGPVLLLSHAPFVAALGKPGVFVAHLCLLVVLCAVVGRLAAGRTGAGLGHAAVAIAVMLLPGFVERDCLDRSAMDLLPVTLALLALWRSERGDGRAAAALLALSAGAKLLPALLFTPLLLRHPARDRALFVGAVVAVHAPIALADARGLFYNLLSYPLLRGTDSTSLSHFVGPGTRALIGVGVAFALAALLRQARRRAMATPDLLALVLAAHLGAFLLGGYFHNNYLVWLAPLAGLWVGTVAIGDEA